MVHGNYQALTLAPRDQTQRSCGWVGPMSSAEPKFPWERSWEGPHRPISPHRAEETRRAPRRVPMGLGFVGRLRLTMCPSPRANCQTPVAKIASRAPSHKIWARALPNSVGGALLPLLAGFWTVTTSMASSRSPPADFVLLPHRNRPTLNGLAGLVPVRSAVAMALRSALSPGPWEGWLFAAPSLRCYWGCGRPPRLLPAISTSIRSWSPAYMVGEVAPGDGV